MAEGARRWFTIRCEMTTSASPNACSIAESSTAPRGPTPVPPWMPDSATLFGKSAWITAGSPFSASSGSTTAGSGSYETATASTASRATYRSRATTTATGSPTWRTTSTATARCAGEGNGVMIGIGSRNCAISAPVNTASTPSMAAAALVSIETIRPCAMSLRLKPRCSMPASLMSSTYVARPWMSRGSSRRLTRAPISLGSLEDTLATGSPPAGRPLYGLDDVLVAGAAAEVTREPLANLALGGIGAAPQQIDGREDHARCAVAALQPVLVPEGLLQRVQRPLLGQP